MVLHPSNAARIATRKIRSNNITAEEQKPEECYDQFFDRKVENATEGLKPECYKQLYRIPYNNAVTVANYIYFIHEI